MQIQYLRQDGTWYWTTRCKGGAVGNYYEQSRTWLGALIDFIAWKLHLD